MKEEELIEKLENVNLSGIEVESHRIRLRTALLQSGYCKEKPGPGFFSLARLKLIASLIAHRPLWQKATATALVAAMILGIALFIQSGKSPSVQAVIDKSRAATMEITSLHYDETRTTEYWYEGTKVFDSGPYAIIMEGEFLAPDRFHRIQTIGQKIIETWSIGDKSYHWDSELGWRLGQVEEVNGQQIGRLYRWDYNTGGWELLREYSVPDSDISYSERFYEDVQPKSIAERLSYLEDIEELPDEVIDGVNCLHYMGGYEWSYINVLKEETEGLEKELKEESDPDRKERLQYDIKRNQERIARYERDPERYEEFLKTHVYVIEIWIGSDDYLVRQERKTITYNSTDDNDWSGEDIPVPEGATITIVSTWTKRYSCFNEPVEIEVPRPVNRQGQWES